jgi:hypothetical protein
MSTKPDTSSVMGSLKDFQRATVEHVFQRLWTDDDSVKKFLVADEVGLGKTMVAKGLIAKTVEHLWDSEKRIDIVYICSNGQIARQNLSRLNVVGGEELKHADRLTMLPSVIRQLQGQRINFVSFTPGTSFQVGESGGKAAERVLLYWMLGTCWGDQHVRPQRWKKFFEGGVQRERFQRMLAAFDRSVIDPELAAAFGEEVDAATGPEGRPLRDELEECVHGFNYLRGAPSTELSRHRYRLIGVLRGLIARSSVHALQPDLVIMDEFQRFKDLLDSDDEGAQLAHEIFNHEDAKVLLLSATPYKMYTLPDEPEGDDHYQDFTRTVKFLADPERAHVVERELRAMREALIAGGSLERARQAKDRVEAELRRVMCRTERLSSTPDRDGMLREHALQGLRLEAEDLHAWRTFDEVARRIDRHDVFEYWRSTPYPLNVMDQNSYQVKVKFEAAADSNDAGIAEALTRARGLLNWSDIEQYRQLDPGNAKMRGLVCDVLDRGAWKLAWLPPSLPYYELGGAYAEPALRDFTKRLVFSAWSVVPKAISVVLSYEAERRAVEAAGGTHRSYSQRVPSPPLQYRMDEGRPAGMPGLALAYPCLALARVGDPLEAARSAGQSLTANREAVYETVRQRVQTLLESLPHGSLGSTQPDQRWYWAAPFLLDRLAQSAEQDELEDLMRDWASWDQEERQSGLSQHIQAALDISADALGPRPDDLVDVLTMMSVAGPGVCGLRALTRVCGGSTAQSSPELRDWAYAISAGLRSMFNKPEIVTLLRADDSTDVYWRTVLEHSFEGCLQAVLDELVHVLIESEGLQDKDAGTRAEKIALAIEEALTIKTANNTVEHIRVKSGVIQREEHRVRTHLAARFGRAQTDDKAAIRESSIRTAYNSPFRPFVLASTSVGQEGLDFHTYSHAIVHWNLPGNPVDLEQREGRVHRYKGHAVRKNIARQHADAAFHATVDDPWFAMFLAAEARRSDHETDLSPYWIYAPEGGACIERYVPALPLSKEEQRYRRLLRTVGAYRLVIGQPRQEDLLRYVGSSSDELDWLRIDLTPKRG